MSFEHTLETLGPDPSEDHIVEFVNTSYAVFSKSDGTRVERKFLNQFWDDAGILPDAVAFDQRVLYDPSSRRFFAVGVDRTFLVGAPNNFLVAVSNSPDPTDGWTAFKIDSDSTDQFWADFPTIGFDAEGVYIAANMFEFGASLGSRTSLLVLPKSDLLAPTPTIANGTLFENLDVFDTGFTIQPIVDLDSSGLPLPLLSAEDHPQFPLTRSTLTGSVFEPILQTAEDFIPLPFVDFPPDAEQPGPKQNLDNSLGSRFSGNVVLQNGALWAVQTVGVAGRAALRWLQIDPGTNVVLQLGLITDDGLDLFYPSIAVNHFDEVVIGFNGSSELQFVSAYAVAGETVEGVTTFGDLILLKEGEVDYERFDDSGRNRWGDYSATVVDPSDPRVFWTFQEWPLEAPVPNAWATQITQLILVPEPTPRLMHGWALAVLSALAARRRLRLIGRETPRSSSYALGVLRVLRRRPRRDRRPGPSAS